MYLGSVLRRGMIKIFEPFKNRHLSAPSRLKFLLSIQMQPQAMHFSYDGHKPLGVRNIVAPPKVGSHLQGRCKACL